MSEILRKVVGVFSFKDDASKEVKKLDKNMSEAKETATDLQNVMKLVGGAAVVAAIKAVGSAVISASAELETQQVRLKNLAGDGYGELKNSIDAAIESSQGLANEGMLSEAANRAFKFGASIDLIKNSMGDMQKLAAITGDDLSQMFQGMSKDIATGSTEFLQQNALLSKHMEAFKAIGPGYDEATKKRRELFLLDAMQKESIGLQEQYNEVLETTNGLLAVTDSQWGNVKERLGDIIAKGFKPIIKIANSVLKFLGESEKGLVLLKVAVVEITSVIGAALVAALYTAAPAAWAFVAPFLPFIAIAAAVAAAIGLIALVIEDVITWIQGGESVIGEFFENIKKYVLPIMDTIKNFFSGKMVVDFMTTNITGKAEGGPVSAGTPYIVGEEGPELFIPGRSGTIVPNGRSGGSLGSIVGQVVINVSGPQEAGEAVKTAVLNALNDLSRNVFRAELGMEVS